MARTSLSSKQKQFVSEYLVDCNGTRAALAAGYAKRSARQQASRLLTNDNVGGAIAAGMKRLAKKTDISAERVLRELAAIAFADLPDAVDFKDGVLTIRDFDCLPQETRAALSEIGETKEGFRIKMHSKIQALELIGKNLGLFAQDQNLNHRFPNGDPFEQALKDRSNDDLVTAESRLDSLCATPVGGNGRAGGNGFRGGKGDGNGNGNGKKPA